jgi:hypothetical protein
MNCLKCGRDIKKVQLWFLQDVPEFLVTAKFSVVSKVETRTPPDARLCVGCSGEIILMAASALHMHLQSLQAALDGKNKGKAP